MKILHAGLMAAAALLLAGCDEGDASALLQTSHPARHALTDSVIPSGFQINDHGKRAYIMGESRCPDSKIQGCVIVGKQASTVAVSVWTYGTDAPRDETWRVTRSGELTRLTRPDNTDVQPWAVD